MSRPGPFQRAFNRLSSLFPASDPAFADVRPELDTKLDRSQAAAAFTPATRVVVQAGAGSGKTRVLTVRLRRLLDAGVSLHRIRVVTFTRNAREELVDRLAKDTGRSEKELKQTVTTIHGLAVRALKQLRPELRYSQADLTVLHDPVRLAWDAAVEEEVARSPRFRELLVELARWQFAVVDPYELHRKQNALPEPGVATRSGVRVRSELERTIADSLTSASVAWEYERPVLWAEAVFRPAFHIPELDAYIDVLELWNQEDLRERQRYRQLAEWKRQQIKQFGYELAFLQLQPEAFERGTATSDVGRFLQVLRKLTRRRLRRHEQRIQRLQLENTKRAAALLAELDEALLNNEMTVEQLARHVPYPARDVLPHFERIGASVERRLGEIGLVPNARLFRAVAQFGSPALAEGVDYVFIDEFQDVQPLQMSFLEHYLQRSFYVIGDARQSIYGFLGGSPYFIQNLRAHFPRVRLLRLRFNYRSQEHLVEAGNALASGFEAIHGSRPGGEPIRVLQTENEAAEAPALLRQALEHCAGEPLLVLARFKKTLEPYALAAKQLRLPVTCQTFHGSKGLEKQNVLLAGCSYWPGRERFETVPAKDIDNPLAAAVATEYAPRDKLAEERRLFYVAVTRAMSRLFIVADRTAPSPFVQELRKLEGRIVTEYVPPRPPTEAAAAASTTRG